MAPNCHLRVLVVHFSLRTFKVNGAFSYQNAFALVYSAEDIGRINLFRVCLSDLIHLPWDKNIDNNRDEYCQIGRQPGSRTTRRGPPRHEPEVQVYIHCYPLLKLVPSTKPCGTRFPIRSQISKGWEFVECLPLLVLFSYNRERTRILFGSVSPGSTLVMFLPSRR
jgi:hypothetical protein